VNRQIGEFKQCIAEQEAQVADLERDRHATQDARRHLERLRRALYQAEALRTLICEQLERRDH
jgi:hypothetical protein